MTALMSGPRKAAILLLSLGEEAAGEVMKNLNENEIKDVSRYMQEFKNITHADVDRVMNEYYLVAEKGRFLPGPPETKIEYLKKILFRAMGAEQSANLVEGLVSREGASALEQLKWHDPVTIANFLAAEHPQVIAVILSNLGDPILAREVIAALPDSMQKDVLTRYAQIHTIPEDWLEEIEVSLGEDMAAGRKRNENGHPGEKQVAQVLGAMAKPMEDVLIEHLRSKNPELAERIGRRIFSFADLIKIDNYGIQLVLNSTPGNDLVLALKVADEPLTRHFLRNMSADAAEKVRQAMEGLGPVPVSNIETAQRRIANTARVMIEKGEIFPLQRRPPEATG